MAARWSTPTRLRAATSTTSSRGSTSATAPRCPSACLRSGPTSSRRSSTGSAPGRSTTSLAAGAVLVDLLDRVFLFGRQREGGRADAQRELEVRAAVDRAIEVSVFFLHVPILDHAPGPCDLQR